MERMGIRELRGSVAAVVRRAGRGERIAVTVGGHPVAQLGPFDPHDGLTTLDDLVGRGLVDAPRRRDPARSAEPVPVFAGARLDRLLREIRG